MAEQTFLNEGNVFVTNARLNVAGQTYAVGNITSFKTVEFEPSKQGPDGVVGFGFILGALAGFLASPDDLGSGILVGVFVFVPFLLIGWLWKRAQKSTYSVVLNTAAGEVQAVTSKDKDFIVKISDALGNAIVARA